MVQFAKMSRPQRAPQAQACPWHLWGWDESITGGTHRPDYTLLSAPPGPLPQPRASQKPVCGVWTPSLKVQAPAPPAPPTPRSHSLLRSMPSGSRGVSALGTSQSKPSYKTHAVRLGNSGSQVLRALPSLEGGGPGSGLQVAGLLAHPGCPTLWGGAQPEEVGRGVLSSWGPRPGLLSPGSYHSMRQRPRIRAEAKKWKKRYRNEERARKGSAAGVWGNSDMGADTI